MNGRWRAPATRPTTFHSQGRANSLDGDGGLSLEPPQDEPPDRYEYDPCQPGSDLWRQHADYSGRGDGPARGGKPTRRIGLYRRAAGRGRLKSPDPSRSCSYASSSATDTDFTAKLVDVRPDGYAQNIADGILRARYRDSLSQPTLLRPDEPYEFRIEPMGHQPRVSAWASSARRGNVE